MTIFDDVADVLEDALSKCTDEPEEKPKIKPEFIKHFPTSAMTNGIEQFYVRLCATISGCMYNKLSNISQFNNLDQGYNLSDVGLTEPPKVLLYDNHGMFEVTNPPFSVTVAGKKMILAWRGSTTAMDWDRDFGFYVASSFRWKNVADVVSVQGAYLALVESCMSKHQDFIIEKIKEHGVTEIMLTGHSLAGGVAQVAHLWFSGTMDPAIYPEPNPWRELKDEVGLTVRTMSFEGPMTTVFIKSGDETLNKKGIDFINKCSANMCTTCYHMDAVPRMYGYNDFGLKVLENFKDDIGNSDGWIEGSIEKKIVEYLWHKFKASSIKKSIEQSLKDEVNAASQFQNLGHVLYYESQEAQPKVCIDDPNGILTTSDGKTSTLPQFRDIKYEPVNKGVLQEMYYDHMYIIFGPGLTLNWQPYFEHKLIIH